MSTLLATLPPTVALLLLCAVVWWRTAAVEDALARFSDAILATLTADDPLPIAPDDAVAEHVLDARDLSDEQLFAEVLRRNGGPHEPEPEEQP